MAITGGVLKKVNEQMLGILCSTILLTSYKTEVRVKYPSQVYSADVGDFPCFTLYL